MIKYKLKCKSLYCGEQNDFDGWFQNIEAFEKQIATLVIGFGVQAVFLEALLAQLSFATEDEQKALMLEAFTR